MTRIIICQEKNGTRYEDASTDELWAESALKILTERFNEGYWYYDPREDHHPFHTKRVAKRTANAAITDDQIEAAPEQFRNEMRRARETAIQEQVREAAQVQAYERIAQVVRDQDSSFITVGRGRYAHDEPIAWQLLVSRTAHEYESVELVDVPGFL